MSTKEETITRTTITYPNSYHVVMHNDDTTPMPFVVQLLIEVFGHSMDKAKEIMLAVHTEDKAVVGTYLREVANQKSADANAVAQQNGYPLKTTVEQQ